MIKKTLYFGNPCYLKKKDAQLILTYPNNDETKQVPIEDIGLLIIDHPQVTFTQGLLSSLMENNTAVITCNSKHMPLGLTRIMN